MNDCSWFFKAHWEGFPYHNVYTVKYLRRCVFSQFSDNRPVVRLYSLFISFHIHLSFLVERLKSRMLSLMLDYWDYYAFYYKPNMKAVESFRKIFYFHPLHSCSKQPFSSFLPNTAILKKDSVKIAVVTILRNLSLLSDSFCFVDTFSLFQNELEICYATSIMKFIWFSRSIVAAMYSKRMLHFHTLWKYKKTSSFHMISGGIKMNIDLNGLSYQNRCFHFSRKLLTQVKLSNFNLGTLHIRNTQGNVILCYQN